MASITFRTKPKNLYGDDDTPIDQLISVPALTRSHCDMAAFRKHPKFRGLANSDLFPNILARIRREIIGHKQWLRLSQLPPNVKADTSGFLTVVTIEV